MKKVKLYLWLSAVVIVIAAGLYGVAAWQKDGSPDPATIVQAKSSSAALNAFGMKIIAAEAEPKPQQNVFVSPLSIFEALGMAESGAEGHTRGDMRQAMQIPADVTEEQLHSSASAAMKVLKAERGVELSIANAIWSDRSLPLSASFIQRCQKLYAAKAASMDFHDPASAAVINNWVKKQTRDKIPTIVSQADLSKAKTFIANAVYFHGDWAHQFPKANTQPAIFHLSDGREKQVPMMHQSKLAGAYRQGDGFEAAALDYRDSHLRLYAILPAPGISAEAALAKISVEELASPSGHYDLDLSLPRFTMEFSGSLNASLTQMGMGPAFETTADFTGMGPGGLYIGDVAHKIYLSIDEEGTTAAAVTGMRMPSSVPIFKNLVFDRPFALVLCDTQTNTILFAGVVYEP